MVTPLVEQLGVALQADLAEVTVSDDTGYVDAVRQLLGVVRAQLGMQVAWVSEFVGADQVLRYVDAEPGAAAPVAGTRLPLGGTFCSRVLDGRMPSLIPDARAVPEAALINATSAMHFGAYIGVPLVGPQGVATGMLCAVHDSACPTLGERDLAAVRLLAQLLHDLQERASSAAQVIADQDSVRQAVQAVIDGHGRHTVLQPVVDLRTGRAVAVESLTRFTAVRPDRDDHVGAGTGRSPAQWFDDASRLGLRAELEIAAAAAALDLLDTVPPSVALAINLGPEALLGPGLPELLEDRPLGRVVIELTEHAPVTDYPQLGEVLRPYREAGVRMAVDDAGAGYASLQHVLAIAPDLIKVDMALTRGADSDLARRTLLTALEGFATATGCLLVAEGVETSAELQAVASCGIRLAQGYHLGRPSASPTWEGLPTA